jgi:hypothetical protein
VVQPHAPAFVGGVLGGDRLAHRAAHRRLLAGIGAQLAAQHCEVPLLLQGSVIPALDRREAETGMRIAYGMMPRAFGECRDRGGELALRRGCRKALEHRLAAQPRRNPTGRCSMSIGRLPDRLWWAPGCLLGEPGLIQNLSLQGLIDVRFDQVLKCISRLVVFPPAVPRPLAW